MRDLRNRAVLVTGAASGIGRAASIAFASEGANPLILNDIDEAGLEETASAIRKMGRETITLPADVSDAAAVAEMVTSALEYAGKIDILVTVAGVVGFCPVEDLTIEDWKHELGVDLWGVIHTVNAVYPHMVSRGEGHILNVASSSGLFDPVLYLSPYVTAKFAVVGFSEALMLEARPNGIGVSCVCPGSVDTPIKNRIRVKGFAEGAGRLVQMALAVSSTPEATARIIVDAVKKNRFLVVTTGFARACYFVRKHFQWLWFGTVRKFAPVLAFAFKRYRV